MKWMYKGFGLTSPVDFFDFVKEGSILLFLADGLLSCDGPRRCHGVYVYKLVHSKCKVRSG